MFSENNKFTFQKQDKHGKLSFFDYLVKRNFNESQNLAIYHKPIHSNRYTDFNSARSFSVKEKISTLKFFQ